MSASLQQAVVRARERLLSGALTEAQVSRGPVLSILHGLGWDTFDVDSVVPEYSVGGRRVDYALKAHPATPDVFLEIKAPGKADDLADKQLFEYAFHAGVPFAVLTDGRLWNFYLPSGQGDYQERRLFKLDLVERGLDETCERLSRYLAFDRIKKGIARDEAVKEFNARFQQNKLKELIPKVWQQLMSEPDDLLCDLLIEAVEAEAGQRPLRTDVALYLQSLASASDSTSSLMPPTFPVLKPAVAKAPGTPPQFVASGGAVGFRVGQGPWQVFPNGKQCYVGIVRYLVTTYPEFAERFRNAKVKGKRAWLAKTKEELFPGRPDFQATEVTEVGGGWLVGTQMSAQVEMPKRVEAACGCVGLIFGRDLEARFI